MTYETLRRESIICELVRIMDHERDTARDALRATLTGCSADHLTGIEHFIAVAQVYGDFTGQRMNASRFLAAVRQGIIEAEALIDTDKQTGFVGEVMDLPETPSELGTEGVTTAQVKGNRGKG